MVMSERSGELSELLQRWSGGDARAQEEVFRLCYGELRHIARAAWSRERAQFSLRPTEIVNEAFLRLQGAARIQWNDSRHFFAVFSRAMRRAIIDHCRSANALKRPHAQHALSVDDLPIGEKVDADNILGVSLALEAVETIDPFRAEGWSGSPKTRLRRIGRWRACG
jgi:RNA polymerase sigma factor (TIGR02999 family)